MQFHRCSSMMQHLDLSKEEAHAQAHMRTSTAQHTAVGGMGAGQGSSVRHTCMNCCSWARGVTRQWSGVWNAVPRTYSTSRPHTYGVSRNTVTAVI